MLQILWLKGWKRKGNKQEIWVSKRLSFCTILKRAPKQLNPICLAPLILRETGLHVTGLRVSPFENLQRSTRVRPLVPFWGLGVIQTGPPLSSSRGPRNAPASHLRPCGSPGRSSFCLSQRKQGSLAERCRFFQTTRSRPH